MIGRENHVVISLVCVYRLVQSIDDFFAPLVRRYLLCIQASAAAVVFLLLTLLTLLLPLQLQLRLTSLLLLLLDLFEIAHCEFELREVQWQDPLHGLSIMLLLHVIG